MATNPPLLLPTAAMPVPFESEMFVLTRQSVEFESDKIPECPGGSVSAKGSIYLSNVRLVFVADKPVGNFFAFDMPLLYIHEEKFNQPIFFANNITGKVNPVILEDARRALYAPHSFKIIFKEGGCGTFVPLFFNLLKVTRQYQAHLNPSPQFQQSSVQQPSSYVYSDPMPATPPSPDEIIRQAYVDPNDPTKIFLQQPYETQPQLRRRTYRSEPSEVGQL